MKVFLDDVRMPEACIHYMYKRIGKDNPIYLEDWEIVRTYENFCKIVEENIGEITHISFDHDLADVFYNPKTKQEYFAYGEKTGYDCAVFLKNLYNELKLNLPILYVHSMNPVGTQNIINLFK